MRLSARSKVVLFAWNTYITHFLYGTEWEKLSHHQIYSWRKSTLRRLRNIYKKRLPKQYSVISIVRYRYTNCFLNHSEMDLSWSFCERSKGGPPKRAASTDVRGGDDNRDSVLPNIRKLKVISIVNTVPKWCDEIELPALPLSKQRMNNVRLPVDLYCEKIKNMYLACASPLEAGVVFRRLAISHISRIIHGPTMRAQTLTHKFYITINVWCAHRLPSVMRSLRQRAHKYCSHFLVNLSGIRVCASRHVRIDT